MARIVEDEIIQNRFTEKPWGGEVKLTSDNLPFAGKYLRVKPGCRLSLQYHDTKDEVITLVSGTCYLIIEDSKIRMEPRVGYHIKPGVIHRIVAVSMCDLFEVSSPEVGKTHRIEDDYERDDVEVLSAD